MPDFSVPDWIKPPSEAEQARIDEAELAAQRNAGFMIRRGIGMSRMNAEAQQAVQQGVDPVTARQNALMNNAHLLFADNPAAVSNIINSQEARQIKERALLQSQAALAETARYHSTLAEQAKATLAERSKYHADALEQKKAATEKANAEFPPSIVSEINPVTGKPVAILRKSRGTAELVEPKTASKLTEVDKSEIKSIYSRIKELQKAHDELAPEEGAVKEHPNTIKRMRLNLEITKLKDRAKSIEQTAKGETGAPDQAPAKLELKVDKPYRDADGKVRTYKGVDKDGHPIWE